MRWVPRRATSTSRTRCIASADTSDDPPNFSTSIPFFICSLPPRKLSGGGHACSYADGSLQVTLNLNKFRRLAQIFL